jgi:hypothetical protein
VTVSVSASVDVVLAVICPWPREAELNEAIELRLIFIVCGGIMEMQDQRVLMTRVFAKREGWTISDRSHMSSGAPLVPVAVWGGESERHPSLGE